MRVMSHEVNNSVTASNSLLQSCLTYARRTVDGSRRDFEQAIGIVIQRTAELNRFMRRFADVFRLPAPVQQPERVVPLLEGHRPAARAPGRGLRPSRGGGTSTRDLTVPMDRGQMEQAFLNVLQNAVEAIGAPARMTIRLAARGGRPTVMVEDSGPGMAPEAQANLFTPFFSTKPHGQGIGLTLVREILAGHGFDYSLERQPGSPRVHDRLLRTRPFTSVRTTVDRTSTGRPPVNVRS